MPVIEILVGMVASGKSTYAKRRAAEGFIVINDDAIVNAVHADQYTLYDESLKPLYKGTEVFIMNTAVAMGKNVLVDKGLNLSRRSRERWIALGRSLDVAVECMLFEVFAPEVHAERRAAADLRGHDHAYWLKVAKHHFSVYEEPSLVEGFSSVREMSWKTT